MSTAATKRRAYDSDLTDQQWAIVAPRLPPAVGGGRKRSTDPREVLNSIYYRLHTGCTWRMLPHDWLPKSTVYEYFSTWRKDGTWKKVHDTLCVAVRVAARREPQPSASIMGSPTVKTTEVPRERGYDAEKKIKGHSDIWWWTRWV